jgi:hypothetical protein
MAYASTAIAGPNIRLPHMAMPKLRWLRPSRRTRALLMMGVMISPCFLADTIGYCVQRLFYTADQLAEREAPDAMLAQIRKFDVACPATDTPAAAQENWASYAALRGWPMYPQAGARCFNPDRNLRGVIGLKVFSVACPTAVLSALDQRRWVAYAADHDWGPYPQAGAGCVDP